MAKRKGELRCLLILLIGMAFSISHAARITVDEAVDTQGHDAVGQNSKLGGYDPVCQFECGATNVAVNWEKKDGSTSSINFTIGKGSRISYETKDSECMSDCFVVDYSAGARRCGYLSSQYKVAKASKDDGGGGEDFKLCCLPKKCNYVPNADKWVVPFDDEVTEFEPLGLLNDIERVNSNTCLCCDRQKEFIQWGYEVRDHCRLGYMPEQAKALGHSAVRYFTLSLASSLLYDSCEAYCKHYDAYKFPKFSWDSHSLVGGNDLNGIEETAAELSYQDHCLDDYVTVTAQAGRLVPSKEISSDAFESSSPSQDCKHCDRTWDRVIAYRTTQKEDGACTTRYRLECPRNANKQKRAAVVKYKVCCQGKDCVPEGLQSESTAGYEKTTWLTEDDGWNKCISQSEQVKFYTNIQLHEGNAAFSRGAQLMGVRKNPTSGCMSAYVTARQEFLTSSLNTCPDWLKVVGYGFFQFDYATNHKITSYFFGKNPDTPQLRNYPGMFDEYTTLMYGLMVHMSLRTYRGANHPAPERMAPPTMTRSLNKLRTYELATPSEEIDVQDNMTSGLLMDTTKACAFLIARSLSIKDDIGEVPLLQNKNRWATILKEGERKMDFLQKFFAYTNEDGEPVYPTVMTDYPTLYKNWQTSEYSDELERHLAFEGIGCFRTKLMAEPISNGGETAIYHLDMLIYGSESLKLRDPDFSKWGAEMVFSAEGMPLMVRFPDGKQVWKGESEWQYAKFVWRSTLINSITLLDHLWFTHFQMANGMAVASRELLNPDHPLRRLFAVFSWGTPVVNQAAAHQLAGAKAMLHRMTPFRDFGVVSQTVLQLMPTFQDYFGTFFDEGARSEMPELIANSPFYQDGQELFNAMSQLVEDFVSVYERDWCMDEAVYDEGVINYLDYFNKEESVAESVDAAHRQKDKLWLGIDRWAYIPRGPDGTHGPGLKARERYSCNGLKKLLKVFLFSVTGWHRHVGTVSDLMRDPELTSPSWYEGHPCGQPRQCMQATLIAATTGFTNPKLAKNSWGFMFKGIESEQQVLGAISKWEQQLQYVMKTIDQRNAQRKVPYYNMHPNHVENSVAV